MRLPRLTRPLFPTGPAQQRLWPFFIIAAVVVLAAFAVAKVIVRSPVWLTPQGVPRLDQPGREQPGLVHGASFLMGAPPAYSCPWDGTDVATRRAALIAHFTAIGDPDPAAAAEAEIDKAKQAIWIPVLGALFCVLATLLMFGLTRTLLFVPITLGLSWLAEYLGVHYQMFFGRYCYTDILGTQLGAVPLVIPLLWFMVLFCGFVIGNFLTRDLPEGQQNASVMRIAWMALVGTVIATAYDVVLDPSASSLSAVPSWIWDPNGHYFGVPLRNFVGWALVGGFISLILRIVHEVLPDPSLEIPLQPNWLIALIAVLPVVFYVLIWLNYLLPGGHPALRVIAWVSLGVPALSAVSSWYRWKP